MIVSRYAGSSRLCGLRDTNYGLELVGLPILAMRSYSFRFTGEISLGTRRVAFFRQDSTCLTMLSDAQQELLADYLTTSQVRCLVQHFAVRTAATVRHGLRSNQLFAVAAGTPRLFGMHRMRAPKPARDSTLSALAES